MTGWNSEVEEPFRGDPRFWRALGLSVDALLALVLAFVLNAFVGGLARLAFVAPAALLLASAWVGRSSTGRTRLQFAGPREWRDAERRAVAAALPGAFLRYLRPRSRQTGQAKLGVGQDAA